MKSPLVVATLLLSIFSSVAYAERKWTNPVDIDAVYYENPGNFYLVFELAETPTLLDGEPLPACIDDDKKVVNWFSDYKEELGLGHSMGLTAIATDSQLSFLLDLGNCKSPIGWDVDGVRLADQ